MRYALRLRRHINIPRQVAATIMKEIDPDGVRERRARRLTIGATLYHLDLILLGI